MKENFARKDVFEDVFDFICEQTEPGIDDVDFGFDLEGLLYRHGYIVKGKYTFDTLPKALDAKVAGTYLIAYLETSFEELERVFGEPTAAYALEDGGDKTDVMWILYTDEKCAFTIYCYKMGVSYYGVAGYKNATPITSITRWHVGGKHSDEESICKFLKDKGFEYLSCEEYRKRFNV